MTLMTAILCTLAGIGLSASAGLNAFLPLLLLGAAARFHLAGLQLNGSFAWLTTDAALITLIIASVVEIVADKIPAVDHALHAVSTIIRPVAGTLAAASVFKGVDPAVAAIAGLVIGAPASLGMHALKSGTRVASSTTTLGCANPVISLIEDAISFVFAAVSIVVPLLVPLMLVLVVFAVWQLARRIRNPQTGETR
jgi:hypothetical protein